MATTKLDHALALARAGFAVFPLIPDSKLPAIKNWQTLATTSLVQITRWWQARPNANIGTPTKELLVVDVDPRNGGADTITFLRAIEDFPRTLTSRTAGGGAHYIYKLPPGVVVRGGKDRLGPGVDIKSWGGFIVAPGSTIGDREYTWSPNHFEGRKATLCPAWLIERCKAPRAKTATAGKRIVEEDGAARKNAWDWILHHAPSAVVGEINDTAYRVAARMFDFGVSSETAKDYMRAWGDAKCEILEDTTIDHVVASAAVNRTSAIGARHPDAPGFEPVEIAPRVATTGETTTKISPIPLTFFDECGQNAPKRWLIKGVMARGETTAWVASPGRGKSALLTSAAVGLGGQPDWLGFPVKERAGTVYFAFERGMLVERRLMAHRIRDGLRGLPIAVAKQIVNLMDPRCVDILLDTIHAAEDRTGAAIGLAVFDTYNKGIAIGGGDEDKAKDQNRALGHLRQLQERHDAHHALVGHMGKDESRGARGSNAWKGDADAEYHFTGTKNIKTVTVAKANDRDEGHLLRFALVSQEIGHDSDGEPITAWITAIDSQGFDSALTAEQRGWLAELRQNWIIEGLSKEFGKADVRRVLDNWPEGSIIHRLDTLKDLTMLEKIDTKYRLVEAG